METEKFKVYFLGLSTDGRTNKWSFTCKKCGNTFSPPTTMMRAQTVVCTGRRKCEEKEVVDYNDLMDKYEK